jgi:NAD(P)-dependent dehydrogenase (short-subunit alcohol dehydrogenase family)
MNPSYDHNVYAASKGSFTHLVQLLADEVGVEKCQIISVHPGRIFTDGAKAAGYTEDSIPWDSSKS